MLCGAFGPVHPFSVRGWACDTDHPSSTLQVEVQLDGRTIGTTNADVTAELAENVTSGGNHGFLLQTLEALPIYDLQRLTVIARGSRGDVIRLEHSLPRKPQIHYPFPASDPSQHPVFILGSVRSGTTAVMSALLSSTRFVGPGEGHVLDLLTHLYVLVQRVYEERRPMWEMGLDTMISAVPESFLLNAIRHNFIVLTRSLFPEGYWFDKTPNSAMILAAPLLKSIWPHSRFIFVKRRGVENVLSRLRRCPEIAFDQHCHGWAQCMSNWMAVREHLDDSAITIEHLELARKPAEAAHMIRLLLSLTDAEESSLGLNLTLGRPEQSTNQFAAIHALETLLWTSTQVATFRRICGAMMQQFGYDETVAYYSRKTPDSA